MNAVEWTKQLVGRQGYDKALEIVESCIAINKKGNQLYLYDEVDWSFNPNGIIHLDFPKKEISKRTAGVKENRDKTRINFYNTALIELKRIKNGTKS